MAAEGFQRDSRRHCILQTGKGDNIPSVNIIYRAFVTDNEAPKQIYLNRYVIDRICATTGRWRDLGIELLGNDDDIVALDAKTRNMDEKQCCSVLFKFWLERHPQASWRQLINALYALNLNWLGDDLETKLQKQISINQKELQQLQNRIEFDQTQMDEDNGKWIYVDSFN